MSDDKNPMTPKQLITVLVIALLAPIILIVLLAKLVNHVSESSISANDPNMSQDAVNARIQPLGQPEVGEPAQPVGSRSGQSIYDNLCISCHGSGMAGAPKMGDTAAWAPRIAQGFDTLVQHAWNGIRAMPAKGGGTDLTEDEIKRAVAYMANKAGASFKAPEAAAAPAADAAPAPAADAPASPAPAPQAAAAAPAATPSVTPSATPSANAGEKTYQSTCMACHGSGVMGAPKLGDKAAWAPRLAQGKDTLYAHAIAGIRAMPAKGGNAGLSDADVKAAVDHMLATAK